jgi:hypothetical protein
MMMMMMMMMMMIYLVLAKCFVCKSLLLVCWMRSLAPLSRVLSSIREVEYEREKMAIMMSRHNQLLVIVIFNYDSLTFLIIASVRPKFMGGEV